MVAILLAALTFLGASQVDRFTDIRQFLAGARFYYLEGGRVVAGRDNTLYYNDKGANFVPWIRRMLAEVRRTWIASMPNAANVYAGHTAVGFTVARDGSVVSLETTVLSGVPGFDNNAEGAIREARLLPLPSDYADETFDIIIVFWVNERPYDIFKGTGQGKPNFVFHRVGPSSIPERSEPTSSSDLKGDADLSGRDLTVKNNTIIYDEPTGTSQRVARLDEGETVRIVAKAEGDFWEVQYGDVHGFVHDLLLKKEVPERSGAFAGQGDDILIAAAERGDAEEVEKILSEGAPVDARDDDGHTALMVASAEGHLDVVRVLLDAGADVNARTEEGLNALALARGEEVGELLRKRGSEPARDTEPELLHKPPDPKYPARARKEMISGEVVLRIKVRTDGTTEVMEIIKSLPYCDDTAKKNAEQWRWKPAEKDGEPVEALGIITVAFDIFRQR